MNRAVFRHQPRVRRDVPAAAAFHADRASGRHRDHRRLDRPAVAGGAGRARGGPARPVREQPDAARDRASKLRIVARDAPPGRGQPHRPDPRSAQGISLRLAGPDLAVLRAEERLQSLQFQDGPLRDAELHDPHDPGPRLPLPVRSRRESRAHRRRHDELCRLSQRCRGADRRQ